MPLNLPDKLPAIALLKEFACQCTGYPSVEDCDIEFDAVEDNHRDGFGAFTFQYTASVGNFVYETQKSYFKEYTGGAHESLLS